MLENEIVEHLIRTADKVAIREAEYKEEKLKLDLLKAEYNLNNDKKEIKSWLNIKKLKV